MVVLAHDSSRSVQLAPRNRADGTQRADWYKRQRFGKRSARRLDIDVSRPAGLDAEYLRTGQATHLSTGH